MTGVNEIQIVEDWLGKFGFYQEPVRRFTLSNKKNMSVEVMTYGATINSIKVPDAEGIIEDVVLGFDTLQEYCLHPYYFGCTVGRVCNRIAGGKFTLHGKEYRLPINSPPNHIHGGVKGFDKVLWDCHVEGGSVRLSYCSADGEEGYPGEMLTHVVFSLTIDNCLVIEYKSTSTQPTPVSLTNHSYFNLGGHASGRTIYDHVLRLNADHYTPLDDNLIPTGEIAAVANTPFDFRNPVALKSQMGEGFDHNFCIRPSHESTGMRTAARLEDPASGRIMEVLTTKPGLQVYTANFLPTIEDGGVRGKSGALYNRHSAICLESQHYPNFVNQVNFPDCVISPGEIYHHKTVYKFSTTSGATGDL